MNEWKITQIKECEDLSYARIIKYEFVHDDDKSVQRFQLTIQSANKKSPIGSHNFC